MEIGIVKDTYPLLPNRFKSRPGTTFRCAARCAVTCGNEAITRCLIPFEIRGNVKGTGEH